MDCCGYHERALTGQQFMAKRHTKSSSRPKRTSSRLGQWVLALAVLAGIFLIFQLWSNWDAHREDHGGVWLFLSNLLSAQRPRVGIVAGHWQHDSGAVCPDGLKEVDINLDIAERTAALLRRAGYRVDLLAEFDGALKGYEADAFLSIHADSCVAELSGFKVARLPESQVAEQADRLVQVLYREYAAVTGLQPHLDTITYDMREYHAFREISPKTPGAIIEVGFMGADRDILTRRPDVVARGIARGLITFVREARSDE